MSFGGGDPHHVLGVRRDASEEEIKRAYRALAKRHHPDGGHGSVARFLEVQAAYESLAGGDRPGAAARPAARPGTGLGAPSSSRGLATSRSRRGTGREPRRRARAPAADPARSRRTPGRRRATLGSTTYDEAEEVFEPDWGGASWYGPSSGTYWTVNPREYADPRKHGLEYQARARRRAPVPRDPALPAAGDAPAPGDRLPSSTAHPRSARAPAWWRGSSRRGGAVGSAGDASRPVRPLQRRPGVPPRPARGRGRRLPRDHGPHRPPGRRHDPGGQRDGPSPRRRRARRPGRGARADPDRRRAAPPPTPSSGATRSWNGCSPPSWASAGPSPTWRPRASRARSRPASRRASTSSSATRRPARTATRSTSRRPSGGPPGVPLAGLEAGERATVYRITEAAEEDPALLSYLEARGLTPGAHVTILARSASLDAVTLEGPFGRATLGLRPAGLVHVLRGEADPALFHHVPEGVRRG